MFRKEGIKKIERLRKRSEFKKILKEAKKIKTEILSIYWSGNIDNKSRFAIVASRKLGKAVLRNKIKRKIREIYRKNKGIFHKGIDLIIIPHGRWEEIDYWKSEKILKDAIKGIKKVNSFLQKKK